MGMLDSLDRQLLEKLGENALQSSDSLARQLNVSPSTIRRRMHRLNQSRVFKVAALVHPAEVGYQLVAVIAFDVAHDTIDTVTQSLAKRPEVKWVAITTGRYDVLALACFRSTDELSEFLQKGLAGIDGIRDTETYICLQMKKGQFIQI